MKKDNKEVKEETIDSIVKIENKKIIVYFIVISIIIISLLLLNYFFGNNIGSFDKNRDISKIKKIINEKYDEIYCVNKECKNVVAVNGNGLKKNTYSIFNISGKKLTTFSIDYTKLSEKTIKIVDVTNKYIITSSESDDKNVYSIRKLNGKEKYNTTKKLSVLNENYVKTSDSDYNDIISSNGKIIYKDVSNIKTISNNKFMFITVGNDNLVINEKGKVILKDYDLEKEIKQLNDKYVIVVNTNNNKYKFFNINTAKLSKYSFDDFEKLGDKVIVSIKDNKYYLNSNGKISKVELNNPINSSKIVKILEEKINKNYKIYSYGIINENQDYVFVKNNSNNSFGTYNLKTKKYKNILNLKNSNSNPIISSIDDEKNIFKVNCSTVSCDSELSYIYDLKNDKEIYSEKKKLIVSNYNEYENGFKVIRYSYLSSNKDLAGKYVLMDNNKKSIFVSNSPITVVDSNLKIGINKSDESILYLSKKNKKLTNDNYLAKKQIVNNKIIYRYSTNNKIIFADENGNKLLEINNDIRSISQNNSNIIYATDDRINSYNIDRKKLSSYKLAKNEMLNDENGKFIFPIRGAIFINNYSNKYIKILNSKLKVLRKINGCDISKIKKNNDGIVLIITRRKVDSNDKYGLYIAR